MLKINKIKFINHKILKNLEISFNCEFQTADTIVLAGENGAGKSTLLAAIFKILTYNVDFEFDLTVDNGSLLKTYCIRKANNGNYFMYYESSNPNKKGGFFNGSSEANNDFNFVGLYSDVEINYESNDIQSITASDIDTSESSSKSNKETSYKLNQLLIDIMSLDDSDLANEARSRAKINKFSVEDINKIEENSRTNRFKKTFKYMFGNSLQLDRVENKQNLKKIYYSNLGGSFPINNLSSGEKQIVYRGCFLLKDINLLSKKNLFGIIDEPEISMHPKWQEKILDYYKSIFKGKDGKQFSQLFFATHSEKVLSSALNDNLSTKVILMTKDENNLINVNKNQSFINHQKTASEINYLIFKDVNIDYHIMLFVRLQSMIQSAVSNKKSVSTYDVDIYIKDYLNKYKGLKITTEMYSSDSGYKYFTLPMCIRNVIDHPEDFQKQPDLIKKLNESIELLRDVILKGIDSTII